MLELKLAASSCIRGGAMLMAAIYRKNTRQEKDRLQCQDADSDMQGKRARMGGDMDGMPRARTDSVGKASKLCVGQSDGGVQARSVAATVERRRQPFCAIYTPTVCLQAGDDIVKGSGVVGVSEMRGLQVDM